MASSNKGKQTLEDHYAALNLQNDDDEEVDLPFGELNMEDPEVESFMLVGTLITEKSVKFNYLKETLSKVWRPMKGMVAKEISTNLFIFYFFHEKDRRRVMENSPWSFDQSLLVLRELEHNESPYNIDLTKAEFWVQIHKLPQRLSNPQMVEALGFFFGEFLKTDPTNFDGTMTAFVRVRVRMDIAKPRRRNVKFKPPGEEGMALDCKYERLPTFCFVCGRLGHADGFCPIQFDAQFEMPRAYGPELRATGRSGQNSDNKWL
ncbi:uncharacterized protein LOC116023498 [Ipomoea triloba]|uniref:uncharacterized protein LOC116023498 n=1 Tax=Ipomoea triloba TaxID=35885 RepID=UPI00125D90E6|nr:uncharacterized protein LOC116023498 [Ipomoea triloba]